jgi:hypothetical protein
MEPWNEKQWCQMQQNTPVVLSSIQTWVAVHCLCGIWGKRCAIVKRRTSEPSIESITFLRYFLSTAKGFYIAVHKRRCPQEIIQPAKTAKENTGKRA